MSHIVESCPLTKLNDGLSRLHCADEDAVSWLTNYGSQHAYEKFTLAYSVRWGLRSVVSFSFSDDNTVRPTKQCLCYLASRQLNILCFMIFFFFSYVYHEPSLVSHETESSFAECSRDKPPFSFVVIDRRLKANDINVMLLCKWLEDAAFCFWQPLDVDLHNTQSRTYSLKVQVGIVRGVLPGFVTRIHRDSAHRWNL